MAAFTSKANGNWSATGQTTWNQSGSPTAGDTVTITHNVTVDTNQSIGRSLVTSPYTKPSASANGGGLSGGSLPAPGATYSFSYAYADSLGNESKVSPPTTSTNVTTAGWIPRITFPTIGGSVLPPGVSSISLYASAGTGGTRRRYRTGITTTTYDMVDDFWENDTMPYGASVQAESTAGDAVQVTSGSLTIATGATLTCKGDLTLGNVVLTLQAGSTLEFDSQSSENAAAVYDLRMGTAITQTTTKLLTQGTSGSHCAIRSNASGGVCRIMPTSLTSSTCLSLVDCTYTDFTRVGNATNDAININNNTANIAVVTLTNCVFDTCGWLYVGQATSPVATSGWSVVNCTWRNSPNRNSAIGTGKPTVCIFTCSTIASNIVRAFEHNVLDKQINYSGGGATWTNNYFDIGWYPNGASSFPSHGTVQNNFCRFVHNATVDSTDMPTGTNIIGNYGYADSVTSTSIFNFHGWATGGVNGTQLFDHNIIESNGDDGSGDGIKNFSKAATAVTLSYNLVLPNGAADIGTGVRGGSCDLFTSFNTAISTNYHYHNTFFVGSYAPSINEGGNTATVVLQQFQSNLGWTDPPTPPYYSSGNSQYVLGSTSYPVSANTLNNVNAANINHNAMLNGRAGYGYTTYGPANTGKWYNIKVDASTPWGQGDVDLGTSTASSTVFVDDTRNLKKWGTTLGYSGTNAQVIQAVLDALRAMNEPTQTNYNAAATIAALKTYVSDGFKVTNANLNNAGHDGITIGALAYQSSSSAAVAPRRSLLGVGI